jgi:hypothetical protein
MRRLALISVALLLTTSAMAAEQTRLAAMFPNKPSVPQSQIMKIGGCFKSCAKSNANKTCDDITVNGKSVAQTCDCSCNSGGIAYCSACRSP